MVSEQKAITLVRIRGISEMKSCNISMEVFLNVTEINKNFLLSSFFFIRNRFNSN